MKGYNYIATVEDSINKYQVIGRDYCRATTTLKAIKELKKKHFIKKHLGNERYRITIKQETILLQDSDEFLTNWKKQK